MIRIFEKNNILKEKAELKGHKRLLEEQSYEIDYQDRMKVYEGMMGILIEDERSKMVL